MTLKAQWYRDKLAKKSRKGFRGYPAATVAFYGPDDTRATKVSVGIVAHEGADADPVERWFCLATDARNDPKSPRPLFGSSTCTAPDPSFRSIASSAVHMRRASIIRKARPARYVHSGATVSGGAARSSNEGVGDSHDWSRLAMWFTE